MTHTIHHGDCLEVLRGMPDNSVDAICCDPPYGLSNTSPDKVTETIVRWAQGDREYVPQGKGFMGASWDAFVPPVAVWDECIRVLKPGGHLVAFAGSRTQDLMGLAIRLAGFDIRENLAWLYGSGFPKSMDVSKAIDKESGAEREVIGKKGGRYSTPIRGLASGDSIVGRGTNGTHDASDITAPATPDAVRWQGWGTALKPSHEPVICARKPFNVVPLEQRLMANVHHALMGLLWLSLSSAKRAELISGSSLHGQPEETFDSALVNAVTQWSHDESEKTDTFRSQVVASTSWNIASSWNSILDALSDSTRTFTTETKSSTTTALKILNSSLGPITSRTTTHPNEKPQHGELFSAMSAGQDSSGDWSNYLHTLSATVPETAIDGIALAAESALADIAESLSASPEAAHTARPGATTKADASPKSEPIILARKPFTATVAANVLEHGVGGLNIDATRIGPKQDDPPFMYSAKAPKKERPVYVNGEGRTIQHSTVKPVSIMKWICRLTCPPGGTILDPFAGSGTTVEAAILEGFHVIGIEREEAYLPLIQQRIDRANEQLPLAS